MYRSEIINQIIKTKSLTKYLEIGVRNPDDCFNFINIELKDGVDPGFENPDNPVKYPYTSDDFFVRLENNLLDKSPDFKWDLIFVDGLHLSYQVEKDVLNSLMGSVISTDIVLKRDKTIKEIKMDLKSILNSYEVPIKINLVDKLETNTTGKIVRK
jgi:hypothetical protein